MKTKSLFAIMFLFFVLLGAPIWATTYYVDFVGGNDTNAGTATSAAWKHAPGDSQATGVPAAKSLVPSDTVIFKGGIVYPGSINVTRSGSPTGGLITYDGNSAGTYGTGRAIIDGEHVDSDARRYGFKAAGSMGYIAIRNFYITRLGGHADYTGWTCDLIGSAGYGIYLPNTQYVEIQGNCFIEIGDWGNRENMKIAQILGEGVLIYGSGHNINIDGNEFSNIALGVHIDARSGGVMRNINISRSDIHHNIRWGITLVANTNGATIQDISIRHNKIRDIWQYAPTTWTGCAGAFPHFDGIIMYIGNNPQYQNQTLGTPDHPIRVDANWFYNDDASAQDAGTAMIFLTGWGGTVYITNNIFMNTLSPFGSVYAQDGVDIGRGNPVVDYHIYNNTFYDNRPGVSLRSSSSLSPINAGTVRIKNNIFNASGSYPLQFWWNDLSNPTELDYNLYFTVRPDRCIASIYSGGRIYTTLAQLQALGYEAHGAYGDPGFADTSYGLGANSSQNNVAITSASPAYNTGTYLPAYLSQDFLEVSRPQGVGWDIGAYEYNTGGAILQLTSPNSGEVWRQGEQRQITWTAQGISGTLTIEILQGETVLGTVATGISAATGTYTWTVGRLQNGSFVTGQNLKIRIRTADGAVSASMRI